MQKSSGVPLRACGRSAVRTVRRTRRAASARRLGRNQHTPADRRVTQVVALAIWGSKADPYSDRSHTARSGSFIGTSESLRHVLLCLSEGGGWTRSVAKPSAQRRRVTDRGLRASRHRPAHTLGQAASPPARQPASPFSQPPLMQFVVLCGNLTPGTPAAATRPQSLLAPLGARDSI